MSKQEIMTMNEKQLKSVEVQLKRSFKNLKVGTIADSTESRIIWSMMYAVQQRKAQLGIK